MSAARRLACLARRLSGRLSGQAFGRAQGRLPPLLAFTDPTRSGDLSALAAALPRGAALVLRTFGAADGLAQAQRLAAICRRRGVRLLVGADAHLAKAARADGVHLPERAVTRARTRAALYPRRWLVTAAAHTPAALAAARRAGVDAAVLSPVFASRSASAGRPLGVRRARLWAAQAGLPVYVLGGVTARTIRRLPRGVFAGAAAIDGLTDR